MSFGFVLIRRQVRESDEWFTVADLHHRAGGHINRSTLLRQLHREVDRRWIESRKVTEGGKPGWHYEFRRGPEWNA